MATNSSDDVGRDASSRDGNQTGRRESILPANINDEATDTDHLGFTSYVEALAAFLTSPYTKGPLTISIEGRWGSGKSSFMKQLERKIREIETLPGPQKTPRSLVVRFNAWRHDKEEAVWAAFALEFIREIRKQRRWRSIWGCVKLFFHRYSWTTGKIDLARAIASWLCLLFVVLAVGYLALSHGPEYAREVAAHLSPGKGGTPQPTILDRMFLVGGWLGYLALLGYAWMLVVKHVGNPLEVDLRKHLNTPRYEGSVAFVERFHQDFKKIVQAYAGDRRVYVFVDDLDRCQAPRSADLMQAINLMISGDPRLVFVIGMDWETVAAGIAVQNAAVVAYLRPEAGPSVGGLQIGHEFLEKFIQLRFALPRPGDDEIRALLETLSRRPPSGQNRKLRPRLNFLLKWLVGGGLRWLRRAPAAPASEMDAQQARQAAEPQSLRELIEFGTDGDSKTIQDVTVALGPALDGNPRRLKQFLGLYRLRTYLAKRTGLLAIRENQPQITAVSLQQLGKFAALELRCPKLLLEAASDSGLLARLEGTATGKSGEASLDPKDEASRWMKEPGVAALLRTGFTKQYDYWQENAEWSLSKLDVRRLLQVSPYVGAFDATIPMPDSTMPRYPDEATSKSVVLHDPKVPFQDRQAADYIGEKISFGLKGFTLRITVPKEAYWRCGFVLAPEDYIRPGRTDIGITQYFLFHVGMGAGQDPQRPTDLKFQIYQQAASVGPRSFISQSPIEVNVGLNRDGRVKLEFGDQQHEARIDPSYLRYLYVLAWADGLVPFNVPVDLVLPPA